tara:strand:- start:4670 stop:5323 length:654 start_codon:yes stop_codon:yes gene_type:complete
MKITDKVQDLENFVQAILSEKIMVGDVIKQSELCDILGISLSPLRELLVLLEELNLVQVKPRSGYKIIYPDVDFMRENMQFRIMIEKNAVESFLNEVTDSWIENQIEIHKEALSTLQNTDDLEAHNSKIIEIDQAFHREIVKALKNKAISKAHEYAQIKLRIARRVHRRFPPVKTNKNALEQHINILEIIKSRDASSVISSLDAHFALSIHNTLVGY